MSLNTFRILNSDYELAYGSVLNVLYTDENSAVPYGIQVMLLGDFTKKAFQDETDPEIVTAIPLSLFATRIPIKNEVVLLIKSVAKSSTGLNVLYQTYYIDIVSLQSNVHHNTLPLTGVNENSDSETDGNSEDYEAAENGQTTQETETNDENTVDEDFQLTENVKLLQPYVGDTIYQGRFGQSIRFSSTQKNNDLFTKAPNWSEGTGPITIIRNSKQVTDTGKVNDFVTEDLINDDSVIVLSSDQKLAFEEASKVSTSLDSKGITGWRDSAFGESSQILLSSRRLIFNSSQNEIIAFAKSGIALSTETSITIDAQDDISLNANRVEIGTDADEQMLLGNAFQSWMEQFIDALSLLTVITPTGPASPLTSTPQWTQIETLKSQLPDLLSEIGFISKTTSITTSDSLQAVSDPPPRQTVAERTQPNEEQVQQLESEPTPVDPQIQALLDLEIARFKYPGEPDNIS